MTGYFAITGELHPLPPSYKDHVWTMSWRRIVHLSWGHG